ncbi:MULTISPECIES: discoidin domain-containing protein [Acinetobacter]|uniref:discoidin domain-containing protein n=1 Tax=Acinetobacter TaxID=469 RepID=UPI000BDE6DC6|nr:MULTISPECIES: discoidin domain-containing protein [Acinetobacter]
MSIEIDFSYHVDGFYHSVNYYRSETPMDAGSMPAPTATGITGTTFTDTTAETGKIYYVRFGSVRDTVEKISSEIVISTKYFRYYRIYITANTGLLDGYSEMQEVELSITTGGADQTTPSTPTNQSSYFATRTAAKLVDNDLTGGESIWTSADQTFPQWVSFDLLVPKRITELRIYPSYFVSGSNEYWKRAPKNFVVQGSNNNSTWEDIKNFSNVLSWIRGSSKKFNLITGTIT